MIYFCPYNRNCLISTTFATWISAPSSSRPTAFLVAVLSIPVALLVLSLLLVAILAKVGIGFKR
jgi:hypothetical protein